MFFVVLLMWVFDVLLMWVFDVLLMWDFFCMNDVNVDKI